MKIARKIIALICITVLCLTAMAPVGSAASWHTQYENEFYEDLAQLLNEQDDSFYFDFMELSIGSNLLMIDGTMQIMDVVPDIQNNRTMLPIRAIAEAAGATVEYDAENHAAVIEGPYGEEIYCPIGADYMSANSRILSLDAPSYAKDGRTDLPVRAVSEALCLNVEWEQRTSAVTITAPYQTARVLVWANSLNTRGLEANTVLHDGEKLWVLQFNTPAKAAAAIESLNERGVMAEPDYYIPPVEEDNFSYTYSSRGHNSWGVQDCSFDTFVEDHQSQFSGSGTVAVLDTGVDMMHDFLRGRVLDGRDFVDGDDSPYDEKGHGTHVAGTIIDCAGDAPISILPIRVLDETGRGTSSTIVAGIVYAADQGADVINLSLGGLRFSCQMMDNAIEYAISKGTTVVVAAGNDDMDTRSFCPAHVESPGVLVVSAGDSGHNKAYFSNYGASVDLMAPGVSIKSSVPGNTYSYYSGTSMATPHVAAAAALIDLAWRKSLSPAELEEKVHSATTRGTWTNEYMGYGFLDMSSADVPQIPEPTPEPTPTPTPTPEPEKSTLRIENLVAYVTDEGIAYSYTTKSNYELDQILDHVDGPDGYTVQASIGHYGKTKASNHGGVAKFQRLWDMGIYTVTARATDKSGADVSVSTTVVLPFDMNGEAKRATSWRVWIPANYKLVCYARANDTTPAPYWMTPKAEEYRVNCNAKVLMPDGSIRYFFVSGDGKPCWFEYDKEKMSWMAW